MLGNNRFKQINKPFGAFDAFQVLFDFCLSMNLLEVRAITPHAVPTVPQLILPLTLEYQQPQSVQSDTPPFQP